MCVSARVCVRLLFRPDASVLVAEKGSLRRGNGSFVFLLILPVDTQVADLLDDLCWIAGEGVTLRAFHALLDDHIYFIIIILADVTVQIMAGEGGALGDDQGVLTGRQAEVKG